MSRFSTSLDTALGEIGETQLAFAERSGIPASQLNKYIRGKLDVGAGKLEQIARNLPERQRALVVAAWLRDLIPQSASGDVGITISPARIAEHPTNAIQGDLSPKLHKAVEYLIEQACRHTEISDLLIDLEKALRGQSVSQPRRELAVVTTDAEGKIIHFNKAFTQMCGYTLEELRGKKPGDVLQGPKTEKVIVRDFHRAIQHAQPFECTITNYHKNGSIYRVHIKMEPVFDEIGKLTQFKATEEKVA